jgi:hypothetical protein
LAPAAPPTSLSPGAASGHAPLSQRVQHTGRAVLVGSCKAQVVVGAQVEAAPGAPSHLELRAHPAEKNCTQPEVSAGNLRAASACAHKSTAAAGRRAASCHKAMPAATLLSSYQHPAALAERDGCLTAHSSRYSRPAADLCPLHDVNPCPRSTGYGTVVAVLHMQP